MLSELPSCFCLGSDGFDILDLSFADTSEDVLGPLLNQVHEGAVTERTVGSTVGEVVGLNRYVSSSIQSILVGDENRH